MRTTIANQNCGMKPETLKAIGECLHGDRWQEPLSRDVGVASKTVNRWAKGGCPDEYAPRLLELLRDKRGDIASAVRLVLGGG